MASDVGRRYGPSNGGGNAAYRREEATVVIYDRRATALALALTLTAARHPASPQERLQAIELEAERATTQRGSQLAIELGT